MTTHPQIKAFISNPAYKTTYAVQGEFKIEGRKITKLISPQFSSPEEATAARKTIGDYSNINTVEIHSHVGGAK